jgi:hypothetical protein
MEAAGMKLILSRKGFDSSAGGVPSPIFPDGRMVSLPIPDKKSFVTYGEIQYEEGSIGPLVEDLTGGRITSNYRAHIDPDIVRDRLPRQRGWRPILGQTGQAQGHLRRNDVGAGDIFLFFGLFRCVQSRNGTYRWATDNQPRHVLWGWFQVAEILSLGMAMPTDYPWAEYHPHFHRGNDSNNMVYFARDHLQTDRTPEALPGAGVFPRFSHDLQLTAPNADKTSTWELPGWFHPSGYRTPLTYHVDPSRWDRVGSRTELRVVSRGQEFVLDCDEYPEAINWAYGLIKDYR